MNFVTFQCGYFYNKFVSSKAEIFSLSVRRLLRILKDFKKWD